MIKVREAKYTYILTLNGHSYVVHKDTVNNAVSLFDALESVRNGRIVTAQRYEDEGNHKLAKYVWDQVDLLASMMATLC